MVERRSSSPQGQETTTFATDATRERAITFVVAVGLTLGGVIAGFLAAAFLSEPLYGLLAAEGTALGDVLRSYVVQPGFGVLALAYVLYRGDTDRFVRLRRPSLEGVAWIALGPWAYVILSESVMWLAIRLDLFAVGVHADPATWRVLFANPAILLPALFVMLVLLAPAEELLYRGVIHGRLEDGFGTTGRVLIGSALFGLMHLFLGGGVGSVFYTAVGGLVFAVGYERTENLLVPAWTHAGFWLLGPETYLVAA